jgi:hypothetical protein
MSLRHSHTQYSELYVLHLRFSTTFLSSINKVSIFFPGDSVNVFIKKVILKMTVSLRVLLDAVIDIRYSIFRVIFLIILYQTGICVGETVTGRTP